MMPEPLSDIPFSSLAAAASLGLLGLVVAWASVQVIIRWLAPLLARGSDREFHHTHKTPVPRLGGVALAASFLVIAPLAMLASGGGAELPLIVIVTALAMFGLGFWDDLRPLGAKKKLLGQVMIALLAYALGLEIQQVRNPWTGVVHDLGWLGLPATVFWLVALTNLINLIDGIDGLAGGISLMVLGLLTVTGFGSQSFSFFVAVGIAGALIGFLRFNFPPARIYLGDGGAYFLGYLIAALTIQNSNKGTVAAALVAPLFALALPILDVTFSIVRRGLKGLPIFRPDRRHIHHRLLQSGLSRKRAVLTLYGLSLVFLLIALVAFVSDGRRLPILFGCVFVVLLVAAPGLGLVRNWFSVGTAVGNSIEMREEVQYALLRRNLLAKDAARCDTVEELWEELHTMARKLRFSSLTLTSGDQRRRWYAGSTNDGAPLLSSRFELQVNGSPVVLELRAAEEDLKPDSFRILSEIVAEAWMNASTRWRESHDEPFELVPQDDAELAGSAA